MQGRQTIDMTHCKTSCEPRRTVAYGDDLRWRIVYQRYSLQLSHHKIAMNLNVDQSTVCRTIALFDATGDVKKVEYSRNVPCQSFACLAIADRACAYSNFNDIHQLHTRVRFAVDWALHSRLCKI